MRFWPERVFGLRVDLMGCGVVFLELLGVPKVQKNGIECIDGLIDGDAKIVVLRSEGRIQDKYCIGSYFTNGHGCDNIVRKLYPSCEFGKRCIRP